MRSDTLRFRFDPRRTAMVRSRQTRLPRVLHQGLAHARSGTIAGRDSRPRTAVTQQEMQCYKFRAGACALRWASRERPRRTDLCSTAAELTNVTGTFASLS